MKLPTVSNQNIVSAFSDTELVIETIQQICKDFGLFGVEINFSGDLEHAYYELKDQLVEQIISLNHSNPELLQSILYQVDLGKGDFAKTSVQLPEYSENEVIAHQIILRDLKKVLLRRYFKQDSDRQKKQIEE